MALPVLPWVSKDEEEDAVLDTNILHDLRCLILWGLWFHCILRLCRIFSVNSTTFTPVLASIELTKKKPSKNTVLSRKYGSFPK